ncbi:YesL family protein [Oceanobacillus jeddahense]|uniref:YesL family protein n=1 Tax=Oceanobacillus jeddahense TaxID=1462527 RepID=UPI0006936C34|nr:DUF624 domain-containing protein [Oceanobacillus jeddahense]
MSKMVKLTNWIFEILSLHMFWLIYIFKGFIILGIFPSTAAVFAVIRNWLLNGESKSIPMLFKQYYKENFKISNILGWFLTILTFTVIVNFIYTPYYLEQIQIIMYTAIILMSILLFISWGYLFPAIVHYRLAVYELFLVVLKAGFSSLKGMVIQVISVLILFLLILKLPGLLLVFGVVPLAFMQMVISMKVFYELD